MSNSKRIFIVNPRAGNGSTGSNWPAIKKLAEARLGRFETFITGGIGEAWTLAGSAVRRGAELIVCIGGDGTLNEVVSGVMECEESLRCGIRLGFIPNGTGCDFVRTVSIPSDLKQAVDVIAAEHLLPIDIGRLSFKNHEGRDSCRYFHNVTSFGLGGEVARRVNRTTKAFGPFLSFIWATLITVLSYGKKRVMLQVDDNPPAEHVVWNVAVANGRYHGGGMHIAPDALVDDGLFHFTIVGDLSLTEIFRNLPRLYNGRITQVEKVVSLTGRSIKARSAHEALLEVDGEQPGRLPIAAEILPKALKVITAA